MAYKSTCKFCKKEFTKAGMGTHLKSCPELKQTIEKKDNSKISNTYYHLKIESVDLGNYWIHAIFNEKATLRTIDDFLRGIWLECCGHLSVFTIGDMAFESHEDKNAWGRSYTMDVALWRLLQNGLEFRYEYDFGSTTELRIKVIDIRTELSLTDAVYIWARNQPDFEADENSPRTGVCGYEENKLFSCSKINLKKYKEDQKIVDEIEADEELETEDFMNFGLLEGDLDEWSDEDDIDFDDLNEEMLAEMKEYIKQYQHEMKSIAKKLSRNIQKSSLKKALNLKGKEALIEMGALYQLSFTNQMTKPNMIKQLAEHIPTMFKERLKYVTTDLIDIYKTLINGDGIAPLDELGNLRDFVDLDDLMAIENRFLIFMGSNDLDGYIEVMGILPDEIGQILQEMDFEQIRKEVERNDLWVNLLKGLLYYYGVVDFDFCRQEIERLTQTTIDLKTYKEVVIQANLIEFFFEEYDNYIVFEKVDNFDEILLEQEERNALSYKVFSKEELLTASSYDYMPSTLDIKNLEKVLKKHFELSPQDINIFTSEILETFDSGLSMEELLSDIMTSLEGVDFQILNKLTEAIIRVRNNYRQWALKGHCPNDLSDAEIIEIEKNQPFIADKKIGRNDPCPCGSGRKYKQCCGK